MVHMAIKVENQLKRRGSNARQGNMVSSWKPNYVRKEENDNGNKEEIKKKGDNENLNKE